mmetsp:Transcript_69196/g.129147  ORF Transcript_69196/g.129147 Transcript_69196/m.129147 type:complete len:207 (+) Transcript_69196:202-822(+)
MRPMSSSRCRRSCISRARAASPMPLCSAAAWRCSAAASTLARRSSLGSRLFAKCTLGRRSSLCSLLPDCGALVLGTSAGRGEEIVSPNLSELHVWLNLGALCDLCGCECLDDELADGGCDSAGAACLCPRADMGAATPIPLLLSSHTVTLMPPSRNGMLLGLTNGKSVCSLWDGKAFATKEAVPRITFGRPTKCRVTTKRMTSSPQ